MLEKIVTVEVALFHIRVLECYIYTENSFLK